jgi:hypothetical protein
MPKPDESNIRANIIIIICVCHYIITCLYFILFTLVKYYKQIKIIEKRIKNRKSKKNLLEYRNRIV